MIKIALGCLIGLGLLEALLIIAIGIYAIDRPMREEPWMGWVWFSIGLILTAEIIYYGIVRILKKMIIRL